MYMLAIGSKRESLADVGIIFLQPVLILRLTELFNSQVHYLELIRVPRA
jgi:hypothetical protein